MIRIGLIGEDPNDTEAVINLMTQKYRHGYSFFKILERVRGCQLDNERFIRSVGIECDYKNPNVVIFVRDADGIATDHRKILERKDWFDRVSKQLKCSRVFLLNIYEIEALILADIETFNSTYKTRISFTGNVMFQKEPKEFLQRKTSRNRKHYSENHCPELFKHLKFDTVLGNCNYFESFIGVFNDCLNPQKTASKK